jgi:hypothetical protein
MAVTTINDILTHAAVILQDTDNVRWPLEELIGWVNDAYKDIVLVRPDANSQTALVSLNSATGTRQKLADAAGCNLTSALRLLDVVRNTAADSTKRAVRLIDRQILDDQRPDWHATAPSISIQHWMYDPAVPKEFMVYPPPAAGAEVELVYASVPTSHSVATNALTTTKSEILKLDDVYANVILDYVLYRAYSKDATYAADATRGELHKQSYLTMLGLKTQSDGVVTKTPATMGGGSV